MWQNFSAKFVEKRAWMAVVLPLWVLGSFVLVQLIIGFIVGFLSQAGILNGINEAVFSASLGAIVYVLTIAMVIGLPWLVKKYKTSKKDLGLDTMPRWLDYLMAPAGFLAYLILSALLIALATQFLTFVDFEQVQETGFTRLVQPFEYILAFLALVVIAPVAEEVLFRGYLFGKLRKHVPLWLAVLITSLLFGFAHGAWNVGIDVFALSIVLCLLRVWSKSLWPSIMLHMIKNALAFYLLFINPTLLSTLGG